MADKHTFLPAQNTRYVSRFSFRNQNGLLVFQMSFQDSDDQEYAATKYCIGFEKPCAIEIDGIEFLDVLELNIRKLCDMSLLGLGSSLV